MVKKIKTYAGFITVRAHERSSSSDYFDVHGAPKDSAWKKKHRHKKHRKGGSVAVQDSYAGL